MTRRRLSFALAAVALIPAVAVAQGHVPPSFVPRAQWPMQEVDLIATVNMPAINLDAVLKEDLQNSEQGLPPRFAVSNERHLTPDNAGTWENLDASTLLWRLRIRSRGSLSLNLGFSHYRMPSHGSLYLHSADLVHVVRPFTAADNEAHGELWTPVVLTDDLVLELVLPRAELDELSLELSSINQGYRGFGSSQTALMSGSCNVDVVCPQGIPWQLEIPSVGVISTGGSTFCTGFLVNNVRQDLKPYFMTANHCGIGAGNAASLVVYWNYENSTCRTPGGGASGQAGDGSLSEFNTGSIFRATSAPSDFTLVELDDPVNPAFNVSWAGWDATGANATAAIAIHHPNTDEKRISFENDPTTTTTYLQEAVPGDGTHVRITDWDLGTTEPGSSGSPLFNQAHRIIGQLHGGFASCASQTSDWYGKFSVSWNGGGTNSTRLRNWLDPDSTGALSIDTVSIATLCSDAGTITLDKGRYSCSSSVQVQVVDCDLNTSSLVAETTTVTVFSTSEPLGESVLLTATGPNTARFSGSISVATANAPGVLLVAAGDTITARYVDADNGLGGFNVQVTDTALVDCTPPSVLSVSFSNVTATTARVTVASNEPILAEASFGLSCANPPRLESSEILATSAIVELTGLLPGSTYFLQATATDEAGNATFSDNGGACYSFTTVDVPNFFTEEFISDNDLDNLALYFVPEPGQDGYTLLSREATALPTNPAGGTTLTLTDDGSAQVNLTGGHTVKLYGTAYSSFFVNANGNLTFGSGDGDYTESLAEHFARARVAALYDDLNPAAGGTVSRKQLADRIAVTWQGVHEYSTANSSTFQIELFFNGLVRITYLGVAAEDGIAGLSGGNGLHPAFVETDLSAAPPHESSAHTAAAGLAGTVR